jgi:hypothetical protein
MKTEKMTVLHINGFHRVSTVFCGCGGKRGYDAELRIQLLRHQLYPASPMIPASAFTMACLDTLIQLSSQSKVSTYDFYQAMRQVTDNLDISHWPVCDTTRSAVSSSSAHAYLSL